MREELISPAMDRSLRKGIKRGLMKWTNSCKAIGVTKKDFYCEALFSGLHPAILSDGSVVCSCFASKKEICLGNLKKKTMEEVWRGEPVTKLRTSFERGVLPAPLCSICRYFVLKDPGEVNYKDVRFPEEIQVENYAECNLKCFACDRGGIRRSRDAVKLDPGLYESIIDDLYAHKRLKRLNLIGNGEPFLSEDFIDFIAYAKARNEDVHVHTSTNGILLDSDEKRDRLIRSGLDTIEFSIHGSSQETYEKYHRGGDFKKALSNLDAFMEQKRKIGQNQKPFVTWKYLLFTWNDSDEAIDRAIELSRKIGVDRMKFALTKSPLTGFSRKYLPFRRKYFNRIEKYLV